MGFSEAEKTFIEANDLDPRTRFLRDENNQKLVAMMNEVFERLPWQRNVLESLNGSIERKGTLSEKQRAFILSMYMDCCVMSDERVAEQIAVRKICYRLLTLNLGQAQAFVTSVLNRTDQRPFSAGQVRAITNIATRLKYSLAKVPDFTPEEFDGWFKKSEPIIRC